jgi:ribonuclease G
MSAVRIRASASPGEVRAVALDDVGLLDVAIERPGGPPGVGDLLRGRVVAHLPALAGAFVALPGTEGFLPDSEGGDVPAGRVLGVRVSRAAQGGKGPRLTARLEAADQAAVGTGAPALLRRGPGAVERLAALHPEAPIGVDDAGLVAALRPVLGARVAVLRPAFDDAIEAALAALAEPEVALAGGGRLSIHPTPALTAIDFDLGAGAAGRGGKAASHRAANRGALPVLARQIRLRNLGGAIFVDFAGLSPRQRAAFGPALAAALADDPLHPRLLGFTRLGLAEIVRPRLCSPLADLLAGPHAAALAALRRAAAEAAAQPARVPALRLAPAVAAALADDAAAGDDYARRTGRAVVLRVDPALGRCGWVLEDARDG